MVNMKYSDKANEASKLIKYVVYELLQSVSDYEGLLETINEQLDGNSYSQLEISEYNQDSNVFNGNISYILPNNRPLQVDQYNINPLKFVLNDLTTILMLYIPASRSGCYINKDVSVIDTLKAIFDYKPIVLGLLIDHDNFAFMQCCVSEGYNDIVQFLQSYSEVMEFYKTTLRSIGL